MYLTKAVEGFLFDKQAGYSPSTVHGYKVLFRHLIDFLGDKELAEITHDDLLRFIVYLQTDYVPSRIGPDKSPLKPSTIDMHWRDIRTFFHWAEEVLDVPRPDKRMPRPSYRRKHIVAFTEEEIRKLLKCCEYYLVERGGRNHRQRIPIGQRDKALILCLLDTGLRIGEMLRVEMKDVSFEIGEILVTPLEAARRPNRALW